MKISLQIFSIVLVSLSGLVHLASAKVTGRGLFGFTNECDDVDPGDNIQVLSAAAETPTNLGLVFGLFQSMLGGSDNSNNPGTSTGFRKVNWDASSVPFDMPSNFFASSVDRGMTVSSASDEFRVSNPTDMSDDKFNSINPDASEDFKTFSPSRLFSPLDNNVFEVKFSIPGTQGVNDGATVSGFGAFFSDVDLKSTTKIALYDKNDCLLAERYVEPYNKGLSFLGIKLEEKIVSKVVITLGTASLNSDPEARARRTLLGTEKGERDIVALDDFLFDEPLQAL